MKKAYNAPSMEFLAFCSTTPIGADWNEQEEIPGIDSKPWNDGELGWT